MTIETKTKHHAAVSPRRYVVIPDETALALRDFIATTWEEIPDVAAGYSEDIEPGHPLYSLVDEIADRYREFDGNCFIAGQSYVDEDDPDKRTLLHDLLVCTPYTLASRKGKGGAHIYTFQG